MLGATDETETARVIGEARLDRHEQRRQDGVPTVSVLAGPVTLPPACWPAGASAGTTPGTAPA